jgi:ketosteroid isomerase-like protein
MDAAVFDRYRDAWNNHEVDAVLEFFTDDGVYEDVTVARVNQGVKK